MQNEKETPEPVGSVIQRTIIPKNLTTIVNVATVPASRFCGTDGSLKELVTQVFGVTTSDMVDQQEYSRSLGVLSKPEFWSELKHFYYFQFREPPFEPFVHEWYRRAWEWHGRVWMEEKNKHFLADDTLRCQLSSADRTAFGPWHSNLFPFLPIPPMYPQKMLEEFFLKHEIRPEALTTAIRLRPTAIFSSKKVVSAANSLQQYDIPFGQSPKTTSDTLENIIKSAKNIVVAPLVAGGLGSATFISTGQYLLAIECAAAASASTIILVATTPLADYIVSYISRQRGKIEGQK